MPNALVRPPAASYSRLSLTRDAVPQPVDLDLALAQHARYVDALRACGAEVTALPPEPDYPDSCFTQDPAFVFDGRMIVCRLGAGSRQGEEKPVLAFFDGSSRQCHRITPPGTIEGGDVLVTEDRLFVGLSSRTNLEAVRQLSQWTDRPVVPVPVPNAFLHLLTGCSYLGDGRLLTTSAVAALPEMRGFEKLVVPDGEEWASNALAFGRKVVIADGFPRTAEVLGKAGFELYPVPISEYQKRDGSITCLSMVY